MDKYILNLAQILICIIFVNAFSISKAQARGGDITPSFVGKNDWLFYSGEFADEVDKSATLSSVEVIQRFNRILSRNGIAMAFVMVPLKIRIYPEFLPDNVTLNPYTLGNYDRLVKALRDMGVNVIDLNSAFMSSPKRNNFNSPLFIRLDTHWSPEGALLAAETVRKEIDAQSILKAAMETVQEEQFRFSWGDKKVNTPSRNLILALPTGSPNFGDEPLLSMKVSRVVNSDVKNLLSGNLAPSVTLIGSSYSSIVYQFPLALRYTLQRDVLAISVEATHGPWDAMETYLRDDSFQTSKPKLLLWEIPERDMRGPPDFKYRPARYRSDNEEWLLRAAAWVQGACNVSPVVGTIVAGGLVNEVSDKVTATLTTENDYFEIDFDKPLSKLDYLSASISLTASNKVILEATRDGGSSRKFEIPIMGDSIPHNLRVPLLTKGEGFTKVKIYPGKGGPFKFSEFQICRQPDDLLN
jgi:alginate O-acetyltransferase complex protein AlgJ